MYCCYEQIFVWIKYKNVYISDFLSPICCCNPTNISWKIRLYIQESQWKRTKVQIPPSPKSRTSLLLTNTHTHTWTNKHTHKHIYERSKKLNTKQTQQSQSWQYFFTCNPTNFWGICTNTKNKNLLSIFWFKCIFIQNLNMPQNTARPETFLAHILCQELFQQMSMNKMWQGI